MNPFSFRSLFCWASLCELLSVSSCLYAAVPIAIGNFFLQKLDKLNEKKDNVRPKVQFYREFKSVG